MSLGKKDLLEKKSIVVKCALMCAFIEIVLDFHMLFGDRNTGILVLCTILVKKIVPVLYTSIVPVL
jgi:hypothetical protein